MKGNVRRTAQEKAGMKLLMYAMKRNVDRVERRYRNKGTRQLCQSFASLCDEVLRYIEDDHEFTVFVAWQPQLPDYSTDDVAYGEEDTEDAYPF